MHAALGRPVNYVYLVAFVAAALSGDVGKITLALLLAGVVGLRSVLCSARRAHLVAGAVASAREAGRQQEPRLTA